MMQCYLGTKIILIKYLTVKASVFLASPCLDRTEWLGSGGRRSVWRPQEHRSATRKSKNTGECAEHPPWQKGQSPKTRDSQTCFPPPHRNPTFKCRLCVQQVSLGCAILGAQGCPLQAPPLLQTEANGTHAVVTKTRT